MQSYQLSHISEDGPEIMRGQGALPSELWQVLVEEVDAVLEPGPVAVATTDEQGKVSALEIWRRWNVF